ncbi:MAG: tetratricopeptide repeat protein [Bacteroidetes bacterium]|nr:tetratricopeptide repeat protein [Bacteroidota bacterium]
MARLKQLLALAFGLSASMALHAGLLAFGPLAREIAPGNIPNVHDSRPEEGFSIYPIGRKKPLGTKQAAEELVAESAKKQLRGDFFGALSDLYVALDIFQRLNDEEGLAVAYNAIGTIHYYDRNYPEAGSFFSRSLEIRVKQGKQLEEAMLYGNMGSLLDIMGRSDSALGFHRKNLAIRTAMGDRGWIPICQANLGDCYSRLGQHDSALHYLRTGLAEVRNQLGQEQVSTTLAMLGHAYVRAGRASEGVAPCREALRLAEGSGSLSLEEPCLDCLQMAYSALGRHKEALAALERAIAVRDSMFGKDGGKGLLKLEMTYAYQQRQFADSLQRVEDERQARFAYLSQIDKERNQKRITLLGAVLILVLAVGLWRRLRFMQRSRKMIQAERDRSDSLLLNILPAQVADELKRDGKAKAREVEGVSILFTDFHDFTKMSERLSAQELVEGIDWCYRAFDAIATRHGLEKIKTIGDSYMCAGGLPEPRSDSRLNTVLAALEMQEWIKLHAREQIARGKPPFRMRAGIHTGPVVAGIVGETKFQYDVWGDTVNIAARIVAAGALDEVNISEATYLQLRQGPFEFVSRGKVMTKGKGELEMFYVHLRKEGEKGGVVPLYPAAASG